MKKRIPIPQLPPEPTIYPKSKCGSCAYRTPSSTAELEMMIAYYIERPLAHPCHERSGVFCHGSAEQVAELETLVEKRNGSGRYEEASLRVDAHIAGLRDSIKSRDGAL